jgi:hypothetical protein
MGAMLAQQLVGAGEHVVDVPAKLSAIIRSPPRGHVRSAGATPCCVCSSRVAPAAR